MAKGKKYSDATKRYDTEALHGVAEALGAGQGAGPGRSSTRPSSSWSASGVDPRKADQMVRGTVALPAGHRQGRPHRRLRHGRAAAAAREAGADIVGADDLAAEVEGGMLDFDLAIATPDQMPVVGRLGRVLGPRGLMPNPKTGTVTTTSPGPSASSRAARSSTAPTATATCTCRSARRASRPRRSEANFRAVLDELQRVKPASAKGRYLKKISVSSTMGPGVKIDTGRLASRGLA